VLAPEARSATDAEPCLQRQVFFPVLPRCPDEEDADESDGEGGEQDEDDLSGDLHCAHSVAPRSWLSAIVRRMKGSEKPKKLQKKAAQKTLKEKRSAKKAKKAKPSSF